MVAFMQIKVKKTLDNNFRFLIREKLSSQNWENAFGILKKYTINLKFTVFKSWWVFNLNFVYFF